MQQEIGVSHGGEDGQVKERGNADVASSMQIKKHQWYEFIDDLVLK